MNISFSPRIVVGTLIATAIFSSQALAAKGGSAKLTVASNKVTIAGHPASVGSTIAPGETIVTGARSRAEITLSDGTVARIGQGSSFSFDGSKLTLNQGSALFNITGKSSKIVTPALVRTGSAGVVSVHASHDYNALFDLKGSATVNGSPLVAGQAWVNERGTVRTFTFDMQKMIGTSTLVTKFPQTPWVTQSAALASVQHQIIASSQRGPNGTVTTGSTTATVGNSSKPPGFLSRLASVFSGGGSLQVSGGTLNMGSSITVNSSSAFTLTGDTNVNLANSRNLTLAKIADGSVTKVGAGTISVGNGTFATISGAGVNVLNTGGTLTLNGNTFTGNANTGTLVVNSGSTTAGANIVTSTVNIGNITSGTLQTGTGIGTLNLNAGGTLIGTAVTLSAGNLVLTSGNIPAIITLPGGSSNTATINGVNVGTLQLGQIVTLNGSNFTVSTSGANPGTKVLTLTPPAH